MASPWGASFDALMMGMIGKVGQFLQGPGGTMDAALKPFVDTISGAAGVRPTITSDNLSDSMTEIFQGTGAFADRNFELVRGNNIADQIGSMNGSGEQAADDLTDEIYETLAFLNFYYAGGGLSFYNNMTDRFAASLNSFLFLVNQALLVLMKEISVKIQKGTIRDVLAGNLELTDLNIPNRVATIQVETFDEAILHLMGAIRTSFVKIGSDTNDMGALQQFLALIGIDPEGLQDDSLKVFLSDGLLDRCLIYFFLEKLSGEHMDFQNEGGEPVTGPELFTALIQQSFNSTFDQNVEVHVSNPALKVQLYSNMLFQFYVEFWSNFIANYLPMLIMDFFNFTHGLALYNAVLNEPFLASMRDLTQSQMKDDAQLKFNLKWFGDEKKTDLEKDIENQSVGNPNGRGSLPNRAISLSEVFKNYNTDHFKMKILPALDHCMEQLYNYTQNGDRKSILGNTFSQIFEREKKYYTFLDPTLNDNQQSWKIINGLEIFLKNHFYVAKTQSMEYLKASKMESEYNFGLLGGFDFKRQFINWVFLSNLILKWVPTNGSPSFSYYLFNTFLRPYRLKDIVEPSEKVIHEPLIDDELSEQSGRDDEIQFHLPIQQLFSEIKDPAHLPPIFSNLFLQPPGK